MMKGGDGASSAARVAFPEYEPTRRYERRWRSGDATPPAASTGTVFLRIK